jgi:hypothetical protein
MIKYRGGVAQLGERLPCTQEVIGSIPFTSTIRNDVGAWDIKKAVRSQFLAIFKVAET